MRELYKKNCSLLSNVAKNERFCKNSRNWSVLTKFFQVWRVFVFCFSIYSIICSMGAVSRAVNQYKNYPGKIEDYEPGHSTIAQTDNRVSLINFCFYCFYSLKMTEVGNQNFREKMVIIRFWKWKKLAAENIFRWNLKELQGCIHRRYHSSWPFKGTPSDMRPEQCKNIIKVSLALC